MNIFLDIAEKFGLPKKGQGGDEDDKKSGNVFQDIFDRYLGPPSGKTFPIAQPGSPLARVLESAQRSGEEVEEKIGRPLSEAFISTARKTGKVLLSPGTEIATPTLRKIGVPPTTAAIAGITLDVLAPLPGGKAKIIQKGAKIIPTAIERGFIKSVKEATPEIADKVAGQYIPRSTDDLAIKAKNLITSDINAAEKLARTSIDDKSVATASELIKHYTDAARLTTDDAVRNTLYEKAADITHITAKNLTEQGRAVQAASILGRLTPEGQLRFAAKEINKYNEKAIKKIPELTGEQSERILKRAKEIEVMPDGWQKASEFRNLQNEISALIPTPLYQKVISIWKAGLLTGLKTHGTNVLSNLFHGVSEVIKDVPAVAVDRVASLFTGERTIGLTAKGTLSGVREGFEKGWRYLRTGFDERNIGLKFDRKKINFGSSPVAKTLQAYEETVFRVLGAEDQPFYYAAKARSLQSQAIAQGKNQGLKGSALKEYIDNIVENPTDQMLKNATTDAEISVFQNKTAIGKVGKKIQEIPGGEAIVPFSQTPAAVAMQMVNYSPAGIVKTVAKSIINKIKGRQFDQRVFAHEIGRGITGTGVFYIGQELFKSGLITLDRPKGEREQKLWEVEGRKDNSILISNKWRSPAILGPLGPVLLVGAHYQRALEEQGSPAQALTQTVTGSIKSLTEQTFLKGMSGFMEAITDPARSSEGFIASMVGSTIPTIVSDVARAKDIKERRTKGITERIKSRIPGLRETLQPRIDILGRETERIGNMWEVMIDPTRPSPAKDRPVINEFRRLWNEGYKVSPTQLGDKYGYDSLTSEQNSALWIKAGKVIESKIGNLINHPNYKNASDEDRANTIQDIIDKSKNVARASLALELINNLVGDEKIKKLREMKVDKLITGDVYKIMQTAY